MKIGLSFKIVLVLLAVSTVLFSIFAVVQVNNHRQDLENAFVEKAESIAYSLDASIQKSSDIDDKGLLLSIIHKNIWLDSEIMRITVNLYEEDSLIAFVSSDNSKLSERVDQSNIEAYKDDALLTRFVEVDGKRVLRVYAPIHIPGIVAGTYEFDMTLENVDSTVAQSVKSFLMFLGAITAMFLVIVFLLVRLIVLRPLFTISKGVEEIGKGNFKHKIKIKSKDELGVLAQAVNHMAKDLEKSGKKLQNYSKDLEKKVKERTSKLEENMEQLEKFNKMAVDRELKMIELKRQIKELQKED